jgi:hypothetical protein
VSLDHVVRAPETVEEGLFSLRHTEVSAFFLHVPPNECTYHMVKTSVYVSEVIRVMIPLSEPQILDLHESRVGCVHDGVSCQPPNVLIGTRSPGDAGGLEQKKAQAGPDRTL